MNVDRPASLVICPALRCCDNSRSRRHVGPKASCRLGPIFPGAWDQRNQGRSAVCQPVIEPSFRNGSRLGHARSSSATRASRTTTCAHRGDAAALVRRNVGTWDRRDDATMSRWIVISASRRQPSAGAAAVVHELPSCPLAGSPVSISPIRKSPSSC